MLNFKIANHKTRLYFFLSNFHMQDKRQNLISAGISLKRVKIPTINCLYNYHILSYTSNVANNKKNMSHLVSLTSKLECRSTTIFSMDHFTITSTRYNRARAPNNPVDKFSLSTGGNRLERNRQPRDSPEIETLATIGHRDISTLISLIGTDKLDGSKDYRVF